VDEIRATIAVLVAESNEIVTAANRTAGVE
jgi:hypothetical protein